LVGARRRILGRDADYIHVEGPAAIGAVALRIDVK
jgi:hypothetical protein